MKNNIKYILGSARNTSEVIIPPYVEPPIYDNLFSPTEVTAIKSAYSTGKVYFGEYNEKSRIDAIAASFTGAGDQSYWRWTTVPTLDGGGKVPDSQTGSDQNFSQANEIKCAAFVAWATDNSTLKATIRDELIAQSEIATTNLSNPIWVQGRYGDRDLLFNTAEFFNHFITAFIYCESAFSDEQKSAIVDDYIVPNAAFMMAEISLDLSILSGRNVASNTEPPYTITGSTGLSQYTYKTAGGVQTNQTTSLMRRMNNRRAYESMTVLLAYLVSNNQSFKNSCEMYAKEILVYGWFPDGSYNEFHRSSATRTAITGMGYSTVTNGFAAFAAWIFNRKDGDTVLYDYTTSLGANGTEGGSKSLLWACKEYAKHFDGTYLRYKPEDSVSASTLMDGDITSQKIITDATWMGIPLLDYYPSDTDLQDQITRTGSGYSNVDHDATAMGTSGYWGNLYSDGNTLSMLNCFASSLLEVYELI